MDYFVSSIGADPAILWGWRVLFFGIVAYVLWTMYARRHALEALWLYWRDQILNFARSVWGRWGPLFKSRTFWGGAIVYLTWRLQVTLPPEALGFATDVVYALSGTFGFVLLNIGRIFASGPLVARIRRDSAAPITNVHSLNDADAPGRDAFVNAQQFHEQAEARAPSAQTFGIVDVPPTPTTDNPFLLLADDDFHREAVANVAPVAAPKPRKRSAAPSRAKAPTKRKTRA